jgi:hypothetical protein
VKGKNSIPSIVAREHTYIHGLVVMILITVQSSLAGSDSGNYIAAGQKGGTVLVGLVDWVITMEKE